MSTREGPAPRHGIRAVLPVFLPILLLCTSACVRFPAKPTGSAWAAVTTDANRTFTPGADRDGDGIGDEREQALRSNPDARDSDGDGFDDGYEDRLAPFGFDLVRADADRDRDGLTDAREAQLHLDAGKADSDGDGWSDFDEVFNGGFGFDPATPTADADFDGLADPLELRLGSSPAKVDSNGDGVSDFQAYSADQPPNGPPLTGGLDELIATPYSPAMDAALQGMRKGARFPDALAAELPYPLVTAALAAQGLQPSAALMQRALANPRHSPPVYPPYLEIEQALFTLAQQYDGSPGADIARLFYWTGQTQDNCNQETRPGRKIYAMKISANPAANDPEPEVAFLGVHHAREMISGVATMHLLRTLADGYAANKPQIRKLVDTREVWVIPVVNPNGYDRAAIDNIAWRKNTRWEKGQMKFCGVDINRNYAFDHVTNFPAAQRAQLPSVGNTGVNADGSLNIESETYPGKAAFSEVESQAVRGLASSQFASRKKEVDGLVCSLSWHAFSGLVMHPLAHAPIAPDIGVEPADVGTLDALTQALATATGYRDLQDDFPTTPNVDGCGLGGYHSYGDASDWLYKNYRTRALSIEAYNATERGGCPAQNSWNYNFGPIDATKRDAVADNNVQAALALLRDCTAP
ncbi:M14 family zinc carboxypeptidase [Lysobacter sp. P5_B9]